MSKQYFEETKFENRDFTEEPLVKGNYEEYYPKGKILHHRAFRSAGTLRYCGGVKLFYTHSKPETKMKTCKPLLIFILTLFMACGSEQNGQSGSEQSSISDSTSTVENTGDSRQQVEEEKYNPSQNFYHSYTGTLGKYEISANLVKAGQTLSGSYFYESNGQPIELQGEKLTKDGVFKLNEFDPNTGQVSGVWMGKIFPSRIEAVWQSPDQSKKLDLQLKVAKGNNKQRLEASVFHEETISYYVASDTATPHYTQIHTAIFPSSNYSEPAVAALYQSMEEFFGEKAVKGNPIKSIEAVQQLNMDNFREAVGPIYEDPKMRDMAGLDWSSISTMSVVFNQQGLFSIAWDYYDYTGGAHGNFGRSYHSYDLSTGKQIPIAAVITKGKESEFRMKMVEAIKQEVGLSPKENLADKGYYEEEIKPSNNFYLTHKGIGFFFSPYEIAPYAAGATEIFIPFKELEGLLQTESGWYSSLQEIQ